jgi:hypothetical protein
MDFGEKVEKHKIIWTFGFADENVEMSKKNYFIIFVIKFFDKTCFVIKNILLIKIPEN